MFSCPVVLTTAVLFMCFFVFFAARFDIFCGRFSTIELAGTARHHVKWPLSQQQADNVKDIGAPDRRRCEMLALRRRVVGDVGPALNQLLPSLFCLAWYVACRSRHFPSGWKRLELPPLKKTEVQVTSRRCSVGPASGDAGPTLHRRLVLLAPTEPGLRVKWEVRCAP